jgi:hypothetical protein
MFRVGFLNFRRIHYTLIAGSSDIKIIFFVLAIIDYKKIKKRKIYGGLQANRSLKTAGLRRSKMANYSWKTADLRRKQNGTF